MREARVRVLDVAAGKQRIAVAEGTRQHHRQLAATVAVFRHRLAGRDAEQAHLRLPVRRAEAQVRRAAPQRLPFDALDIAADILAQRPRQHRGGRLSLVGPGPGNSRGLSLLLQTRLHGRPGTLADGVAGDGAEHGSSHLLGCGKTAPAVRAKRQMRGDGNTPRFRQCAGGVALDQIVAEVMAKGHDRPPSSSMTARSLASASLTRDFTVPIGSFSRSAIALWV